MQLSLIQAKKNLKKWFGLTDSKEIDIIITDMKLSYNIDEFVPTKAHYDRIAGINDVNEKIIELNRSCIDYHKFTADGVTTEDVVEFGDIDDLKEFAEQRLYENYNRSIAEGYRQTETGLTIGIDEKDRQEWAALLTFLKTAEEFGEPGEQTIADINGTTIIISYKALKALLVSAGGYYQSLWVDYRARLNKVRHAEKKEDIALL